MWPAKRRLLLILCVLVALLTSWQPVAALRAPTMQMPRLRYCPTPPSIMLHSADGVYGMQWLVRTIEKCGLQTMTHRQISRPHQQGLYRPENAILVSLDDLGTSWLRQEFKDMISIFTEKGYVLTLGVVTGTEESTQKAEIWDYLQGLEAQGVEIASHSARHSLLNELNEAGLKAESEDSYSMLCKKLGSCPETFILPFGRGAESSLILKVLNEKYTNIVSIHAPRVFGGENLLFKRIPLVEQENNPREPKLSEPFFIQPRTEDSELLQQTRPNKTEAQ